MKYSTYFGKVCKLFPRQITRNLKDEVPVSTLLEAVAVEFFLYPSKVESDVYNETKERLLALRTSGEHGFEPEDTNDASNQVVDQVAVNEPSDTVNNQTDGGEQND